MVERVGGLDVDVHGPSAFSAAEQRLLVVARVLLAKPRFVFLDRMGGELGPTQVARMYGVLADCSISYISIGDLESLAAYHDTILLLTGAGSWRVSRAEKGETIPIPHAVDV